MTLEYAAALFREIPVLRAMVERETAEGLELTNRMALMVLPNDFRAIRGRTLVACIMDEISYWRNELTVSPDVEVYRAAKPALATMPGSLMIGISSPYRRAGLLWRKFKRHWGQAGDVLVVRAPTRVLNPMIDEQVIEEAVEDDPEAARAEWGAEFRSDVGDFVRREVVEALVAPGVYERPPVRRHRGRYVAFTDPSRGLERQFHGGGGAPGGRGGGGGLRAGAEAAVLAGGGGRGVRGAVEAVRGAPGERATSMRASGRGSST